MTIYQLAYIIEIASVITIFFCLVLLVWLAYQMWQARPKPEPAPAPYKNTITMLKHPMGEQLRKGDLLTVNGVGDRSESLRILNIKERDHSSIELEVEAVHES